MPPAELPRPPSSVVTQSAAVQPTGIFFTRLLPVSVRSTSPPASAATPLGEVKSPPSVLKTPLRCAVCASAFSVQQIQNISAIHAKEREDRKCAEGLEDSLKDDRYFIKGRLEEIKLEWKYWKG